MGSLGSAGGFLNAVGNIAGFMDNRQSSRQALAYDRNRQAEMMRHAEANAAYQREKIAGDAAKAEKDRVQALRRAVGRQRASFGASGISSDGGSAQAILLGMFNESDEERQERERLDRLRFQEIDMGMEHNRRLNVLQMQQMRSRSDLGLRYPYEFYTSTALGRRSGW